jgi:hypothetical protein
VAKIVCWRVVGLRWEKIMMKGYSRGARRGKKERDRERKPESEGRADDQ